MTRLLLLGLAALLAACAAPGPKPGPGAWINPDRPPEARSTDLSACAAWAAAEVEREARRADYGGAGVTTADPYRSQMARYDAARRRDALAAACLRGRGYRPVDGGDRPDGGTYRPIDGGS